MGRRRASERGAAMAGRLRVLGGVVALLMVVCGTVLLASPSHRSRFTQLSSFASAGNSGQGPDNVASFEGSPKSGSIWQILATAQDAAMKLVESTASAASGATAGPPAASSASSDSTVASTPPAIKWTLIAACAAFLIGVGVVTHRNGAGFMCQRRNAE